MSDVARRVMCALCGTAMAADTEVCPKCGSLNAHRSYHTQFGALEVAEEAALVPLAPAPHSLSVPASSPPGVQRATAPEPPAQEVAAVRHRPGVAVQSEQDRRLHATGDSPIAPGEMPTSAAAWHYSPSPSPRDASASGGGDAEHYLVRPRPQVERPTLPVWQGPTVRDPDVELPGSWREGMARIPHRPLPPRKANTYVPDSNTAYALEMFGLFGFLGLGHWYGGHVGRGLLLMAGWWILLAKVVFPLLQNVSPLTVIATIFIIIVGPLASGYWISSDLKRNRRIG